MMLSEVDVVRWDLANFIDLTKAMQSETCVSMVIDAETENTADKVSTFFSPVPALEAPGTVHVPGRGLKPHVVKIVFGPRNFPFSQRASIVPEGILACF